MATVLSADFLRYAAIIGFDPAWNGLGSPFVHCRFSFEADNLDCDF